MVFNKIKFNNIEIDKAYLNGELVFSKEATSIFQYSIGVMSDIHIETGADSAMSNYDFDRALTFMKNNNSKFVAITGDLTDDGSNDQFQRFVELRDSKDIKVYSITGNHEASSSRTYKYQMNDEMCIAYHIYDLIGNDFCYYLKGNQYVGLKLTYNENTQSFDYETRILANNLNIPENDIYIFVGILGDANRRIFFDYQLQWLRNVLEEHRNKRCFVFEHCRAERLVYDRELGQYTEDLYASKVSGNALGAYLKSLWGQSNESDIGNKRARCFELLMSHYTNCVWFHGHTHLSPVAASQEGAVGQSIANIDKYFGNQYNTFDLNSSSGNTKFSYSVHVPSCTSPRIPISPTEYVVNHNGSQGMVVDIYTDKVVIKYYDFAEGQYMNGLEYNLPSRFDTIPANSFVDPTGITS